MELLTMRNDFTVMEDMIKLLDGLVNFHMNATKQLFQDAFSEGDWWRLWNMYEGCDYDTLEWWQSLDDDDRLVVASYFTTEYVW